MMKRLRDMNDFEREAALDSLTEQLRHARDHAEKSNAYIREVAERLETLRAKEQAARDET